MAHLLASPKHIPKGETMKKIAILTSVLALAACGGGGGGGGGAQLPPPLPPVMLEDGNSTTTVVRNVTNIDYPLYKKLTSNAELIAAHNPFRDASTESAKYTKSLELVNEMKATLQAWSEAAEADPANGAKNYAQANYEKAHRALLVWGATSTELGAYNSGNSDKLANYFTANGLNDPEDLENRIFVWGVNQGDKAKLATDFGKDFISSLRSVDNDTTTTGNAILTFDNSGKLTGVHIVKGVGSSRDYTVDENGKITKLTRTTMRPFITTTTLPTPDSSRVATFGNVVGLQYSDFGYLTHGPATTEAEGTIEADGWTFAGGYKIMERKPQSSGEFKGVATAVIKNSQGDMMETVTRDASVYVDTGTDSATLTANFAHAANPWYNVQLSNDSLMMDDAGANIPEEFRVKMSETSSSTPTHANKYLVTRAFGEGVDPTEMVATGAVMGMTSATDDVNKIDAHFSFGGKFEQ